jgi:hypothetical protein
VPGYEYRHATWDEVVALGPQGWRLVPVPPIVEMRQTLGQMVQAGEPLYVMERQAGVTVPGTVHAGEAEAWTPLAHGPGGAGG